MAEVNKYVKGRPTEMKKCLNSGLYEQGFEATKTMYLVGEEVILVGNQQDGGKKTSNVHTGKCILCYSRCFIEMCALIP